MQFTRTVLTRIQTGKKNLLTTFILKALQINLSNMEKKMKRWPYMNMNCLLKVKLKFVE